MQNDQSLNFAANEIFSSCVTEHDIAELKMWFSALATNESNKLIVEDIPTVMTLAPTCPNLSSIQQAILDLDIDVKKGIDFDAFCDIVLPLLLYNKPKKRLVRCLQILALDTKLISRDLLRRSLLSFGPTMPEEEIKELLGSVPADGNGNIRISALADFLVS